MKHFHRIILRMLPAPFFGWLGTLIFLLLMQFLIRYLPDIVGKGLPFGVIVELIAYNLAYMVVLAVPMSVLIASLMSFGKLAESNAYLVIKSSGVSLLQLIWPAMLLALLVTGGMVYFNNEILPEANFRAKNLWQDIRRKKPAFDLKPGVFYNGIRGYTIMAHDIPPDSNDLHDVLIFDNYEDSDQHATIKAETGHIVPVNYANFVELVLENGEMHRKKRLLTSEVNERYRRLNFERLRFRLDVSGFDFERSDPTDGYRSDRTMRTADMIKFVDSLETSIDQTRIFLLNRVRQSLAPQPVEPVDSLPTPQADMEAYLDSSALIVKPAKYLAVKDLSVMNQIRVYDAALSKARSLRVEIDDARRTVEWESRRINRYLVEIHKKYSIAIACLIFMLIGAPIGLSVRRGGLGTAGALAIGIFLFYWVTLVQGEKMADRDLLSPWFGMWIANIVITVVGVWLVLYVSFDLRVTAGFFSRLKNLFTGQNRDVESPSSNLHK